MHVQEKLLDPDLVEKVARSLCSKDAKNHGNEDWVWKVYIDDAKCAINAVREFLVSS